LIIEHSSVGLLLQLCGSCCEFFHQFSPALLTYLFHKYSDRSAETRTFVALKILTSQATARVVAGSSPEYDVYKKIMSTNPDNPGFNHCLTIRRCFITKSAAGGHICFVLDPLSSSLAELRPLGQNRFTVPTAKRIIKQVLLALDYLHRECGYIHTGGFILLLNNAACS
jgi:serine/threonine protein kinase